MKKSTIIVMFIAVIAKVLGFIRDITLTSLFGFGAETAAYQAAVSIPSVILTVVGAALISGIIPMLTRIMHEDKDRGERFASNVLNIMMLFAALVSAFMFVLPELAVKMVASGLSDQGVIYAASFVRTFALGTFSVALLQLGTGYLNVKNSFAAPAAAGIPINIVVIIGIFLSSKSGNLQVLAYAQLFGFILQAGLILYAMKKNGFKYTAVIDFKDEDLRIMMALALPLFLSSFLGQLNDVIMKNLSTFFYPDGDKGYVYMTSATKLVGFVQGIFLVSILQVTFPTIAKNVVDGNNKMLNKSINEAILMISLFVFPAVVGFITLANEIVSFVYLRNATTPADIAAIVPVFVCYSLVLFSQAMRDLMIRIHFAYQDMKNPVKSHILFSIVFISLMFLFGNLLMPLGHGLSGLSLAYVVAATVTCIPLYKTMKKHVGKLYLKYIRSDFLKILLSSILMGVVILLLNPLMGAFLPAKISLIVVIAIALIFYIVILVVFKTRFAMSLLATILRLEN
ncbi:MAG: oligosaccharide flippase family protein [Erysipelothrix sp.]